MKAIQYSRFGGPDVLELLELPDPHPEAGQIRVAVRAAGAVGSSAVQIARERGARVIGTASPNNHDYLRSLGAEPTTYGDGLVERIRELAPDGVDAALDAAGGRALPALVELAGGPEHVVTIADYAGAEQTGAKFSGGMGTKRAVHALRDIGPLIEAGRFSLPVAQAFPLERIGDAHRLSAAGHVRGKLVLLVD
jgi:NADPH:quinone reductase-like Zn-dependent oxidoreductase